MTDPAAGLTEDVKQACETSIGDRVAHFWKLLETETVIISVNIRRKYGDGPEYYDLSSFGFDLAKALVDERAALSARPSADAVREALPRWRHKKRGTTYREIGRGLASISARDIFDHDPVVVYQDENDGKIWIRNAVEFDDGRFEALASLPAPADAKAGRASLREKASG